MADRSQLVIFSMADPSDIERARAEAMATVARLADLPSSKAHDVPAYELEDPVARWKREADEQEARFAEQRAQWEREQDEERRRRYASQQSDELGLQAEVFDGIATALETIDSRLRRVERQRKAAKTARKSRPIALPNFLGPTRSETDPTVRYTQPRIQ
jgi:hypothetical protein